MESLDRKTLKRVVELLMISERQVDDLYETIINLREEIRTKNIDVQEILKRLNQILTGINQM